jgi:hypothetical protein
MYAINQEVCVRACARALVCDIRTRVFHQLAKVVTMIGWWVLSPIINRGFTDESKKNISSLSFRNNTTEPNINNAFTLSFIITSSPNFVKPQNLHDIYKGCYFHLF